MKIRMTKKCFVLKSDTKVIIKMTSKALNKVKFPKLMTLSETRPMCSPDKIHVTTLMDMLM